MTLPNGLTAYFETAECNHGQASLYWQQDGQFVTLISVPTRKESAGLSKGEMVKIAASLSKTADLGRVEPAPANRQLSLPLPEGTALTCPTPALPNAQPTDIP
ncbi:MAG: hypothetical protein DLM69_00450 [Candidatus Chloroheliales bacterium]|nr:MAG: hypothetical protein DLM69_00450 [Chloroflexota bacterium]